jgi:hypothetical protein
MRNRIVEVCRVMQALLLSLTVYLGSGVASAQPPALVTDRPDQTESATVVLRGMAQVEAGYLFSSAGDVDRYEAPITLVRVGLGGRTELRIGHTGIGWIGKRHGTGDSNLGVKVNLIERAEAGWPELAILGGMSLPTGDDGFSSDGIDPSFLALFSYELSPKLSLGTNIGASWESSSEKSTRDAAIVYSLALSGELTDRMGTFLELFGDRQTTGTSASVDGGLTFLLTNLIQLDVYVGRGLRGLTDDLFLGTGLSFRVPR